MKLEEGDIVTLELERVHIYDHPGFAPAGRTSTKKFVVSGVSLHGYKLRPVRKVKKIRGWRLSLDFEILNSSTRPPLKYEVLNMKVGQ